MILAESLTIEIVKHCNLINELMTEQEVIEQAPLLSYTNNWVRGCQYSEKIQPRILPSGFLQEYQEDAVEANSSTIEHSLQRYHHR